MNPAMMNKLKKMQKDMMEAQKKLEETIFYGSAGGNLVKVEVYGNKTINKITIDKSMTLDADDLEMLEDTILTAINDAMKKIDSESEETMGAFTGGLGGFGGLF